MKTIAIIHLGYIGDLVNASPVCIELKNKYPESKLIFITIPASAETAKCLPGVNEVFVYDKKGKHKGFLNLLKAAKSFKKEQIDLAVVLNESLRSAFLAFLLGAKKRIGRNSDGRKFLLTHTIPHLEEEKKMQIHVSDHYMRVLKTLDLYNPDYKFELTFPDETKTNVNRILLNADYSNHELIGLCPCARHNDKDWKEEEALKLINYINDHTNKKIVIVGDAKTAKFTGNLRQMGCSDFLDLSCKTTIPELGEIISRVKIFITTDTGPMHFAYTLRVPVVALFYHNVAAKWGPKYKDINRTIYSENWETIKAEEVINEFNNLHKLCLSHNK